MATTPTNSAECPTGSGRLLSLDQVADELSRRLVRLFVRGPDGRRPVHGSCNLHQTDPQFRDYALFYEHFHSKQWRDRCLAQTGWSALVALLIDRVGRGGQSLQPAARQSAVS